MSSVSTKVLKFLLLVGVTVYLFTTFETDVSVFNHFLYSLIVGGLAYLAASIFGFMLSISRNYLIAFILTATVIVVVPLSLAKVQAAHSWFSDELLMVLLCGIIVWNIVSDVLYIVIALRSSDIN